MGWLRRKPFVEDAVPSRLPETGWSPVVHPLYGGYVPDFDPNAVNEFGRAEWAETQFFRLADQSPYFNVAGRMWRVP